MSKAGNSGALAITSNCREHVCRQRLVGLDVDPETDEIRLPRHCAGAVTSAVSNASYYARRPRRLSLLSGDNRKGRDSEAGKRLSRARSSGNELSSALLNRRPESFLLGREQLGIEPIGVSVDDDDPSWKYVLDHQARSVSSTVTQ